MDHSSCAYIILFVCAIFSLIGLASAEVLDGNEIIITPSSYQLKPGEAFTLNVNIIPDEPISGAQFTLLFRDTECKVNEINEGDFFSKYGYPTYFGKYANNADSYTIYSAALGYYQVYEPGTISTISLNAGNLTGYLNIEILNVVLSNSFSQSSSYKVSNVSVLVDSRPSLSPPGTFEIEEGNTLSFMLDAFDHDDDYLVYSSDSLPEGASLNAITGIFRWTPTASQIGEYTVNFEVKDGYLSATESANILVISPNTMPVASINGPYEGKVGKKIRFDSSGSYDPDGNIVSYEWNFGDGTLSSDEKPSHVYGDPGVYTSTLKVVDEEGNIGTDSTLVTVKETFWSKLKRS